MRCLLKRITFGPPSPQRLRSEHLQGETHPIDVTPLTSPLRSLTASRYLPHHLRKEILKLRCSHGGHKYSPTEGPRKSRKPDLSHRYLTVKQESQQYSHTTAAWPRVVRYFDLILNIQILKFPRRQQSPRLLRRHAVRLDVLFTQCPGTISP